MTAPAGRDHSADAALPRKLSRDDRRLLVGLGLPPLAWSLHLSLVYGSSYLARGAGSKIVLVLVTAAALGLCTAGLLLVSTLARPRAEGLAPAEPDHAARTRFLTRAGLVLGLFFAAVILAQTAPLFVFSLEDR